ncbi:hypothetical protein [Scytonema sp. NUACC26]|uniref:hypothetical protein n=1 Tax=Scytonema sp. NUACC26 TaxID=3140176 RepID=UPI0034DBA377
MCIHNNLTDQRDKQKGRAGMTIRKQILDCLTDNPRQWIPDLEAKFMTWNPEKNIHEVNLEFWIVLQQLRDEGVVTVESYAEWKGVTRMLKTQVKLVEPERGKA